MVSLLMSYIDKISSRGDYGDYLDGKFTCRQETTPDSLEKIKITGYVEVTPANVEVSIDHIRCILCCLQSMYFWLSLNFINLQLKNCIQWFLFRRIFLNNSSSITNTITAVLIFSFY